MKLAVVLGTFTLVACSSSNNSSPPFTDCKIGNLSGTWRVTYVETDGNCGRIPTETVVLSSNANPGAPGGPACKVGANQISADRCRLDLDVTCPLYTVGGALAGTQRWIGVTRQVGQTGLTSTMTLTINAKTDVCRSTYVMDWEQQ